MFSETAKFCRFMMTLASLSALLMISGSVSAQSVEENVRPVGQVCLANQACVGTTGINTGTNTGASRAQPAAAAAQTTSQPEPVAAATAAPEPAATEFDVAATYQMSCFACHGTGAAGAPVLGDQEVWAARMEKGIDGVMANVIAGLNAMPAKGLCMTCSDDDLRALVDYMASQ